MARTKDRIEIYTYNCYTAEALKILTSNTAKIVGGTELTVSYKDLIEENSDQDEETEEEIIARVKSRIAGGAENGFV